MGLLAFNSVLGRHPRSGDPQNQPLDRLCEIRQQRNFQPRWASFLLIQFKALTHGLETPQTSHFVDLVKFDKTK